MDAANGGRKKAIDGFIRTKSWLSLRPRPDLNHSFSMASVWCAVYYCVCVPTNTRRVPRQRDFDAERAHGRLSSEAASEHPLVLDATVEALKTPVESKKAKKKAKKVPEAVDDPLSAGPLLSAPHRFSPV